MYAVIANPWEQNLKVVIAQTREYVKLTMPRRMAVIMLIQRTKILETVPGGMRMIEQLRIMHQYQ